MTSFKRPAIKLLTKLNLFTPMYEPMIFFNRTFAELSISEASNPWLSPSWVEHSLSKSSEGCLNIHNSQLLSFMKSYLPKERHLIFDIGGGCGETYRCLKTKLSQAHWRNFSYVIVDSGPLVEKGKHSHMHDTQVNFLDFQEDIGWQDKYAASENSLFLSSVLHYISQPEAYISSIISALSPTNIFITRFPVHLEAKDVAFGMQNVKLKRKVAGQAVVSLFPSGWVEALLSNEGYEVISTEGLEGPNQAYFEAGCESPIYSKVKVLAYHFRRKV